MTYTVKFINPETNEVRTYEAVEIHGEVFDLDDENGRMTIQTNGGVVVIPKSYYHDKIIVTTANDK